MPIAIEKKTMRAVSHNLNTASGDGLRRVALIVVLMMSFPLGVHELSAKEARSGSSITLESDTLIEEWLVFGPFPGSFDTDFLKASGGIRSLRPGRKVEHDGQKYAGQVTRVSEKAVFETQGWPPARAAGEIGHFPMRTFGDEINAVKFDGGGVRYAVCEIESDRAMPTALLLQCDNRAEVYLNGKMLCEDFPGKAGVRRRDKAAGKMTHPLRITRPFGLVELPLVKGRNRLTIKLEDTALFHTRITSVRSTADEDVTGVVPGTQAYRPTDDDPTGFGGDGTLRYPGAEPPLFWDEATGHNIIWKTELPSWSQGSLIVVGEKILAAAEPNLLLCLDVDSGKILWQQAVDQLDAFPADEAAEGRRLWKQYEDQYTEFHAACAEYQWLKGNVSRENFGYVANSLVKAVQQLRVFPDPDPWKEIWRDTPAVHARLKQLEDLWRARRWGGAGSDPYTEVKGCHWNHELLLFPSTRHGEPANEDTVRFYGGLLDLEKRFGFHQTAGRGMLQRGHTAATPCSDGQFVYVSFGWGQIACYDLDGEQKWLKWFPANKDFAPADPSKIVGAAMNEQAQSRVPPLLHGDLLIVQNGYTLRVMDKHTGEVRWAQPVPGRRTPGQYDDSQPHVFVAGGVEVLFAPHGRVYRLSDGKVLLDTNSEHYVPEKSYMPRPYGRGTNGRYIMGQSAWNGTTAYFSNLMGIGAYRFALDENGSLDSRLLWAWNLPFERFGSSLLRPSGSSAETLFRTGPLFDADAKLLYAQTLQGSFHTIDARTGELAAEWQAPWIHHESFDEGQSPLLAGNLIVTHRSDRNTYFWTRGRETRPVGHGRLVSEWSRDIIERTLPWEEYKKKWFDRGYFNLWTGSRNWCLPVFQGKRVYIRTDEAMYCIGETP